MIQFYPHKINPTAPAPPFASNAADNGLSVDGVSGRIVLGNDAGATAAALLSNREIPLAGFIFQMTQGNPNNGVFSVEGNNIDDVIRFAMFTGNDVAGGFTLMDVVHNDFSIQQSDGTVTGFLGLNPVNGAIVRHDIISTVEATLSGGIVLNVIPNDGFHFVRNSLTNHDYFSIDMVTRLFQLGDIGIDLNGSAIAIDDTNRFFSFYVGAPANEFLKVDPFNSTYWLGDIPAAVDSTYIYNDAINFNVNAAGNQVISTDINIDQYIFGDISTVASGIRMNMIGPANQIAFDNAAHNVSIVMNTVLGFTGTVAPVNTITVNGGIVTNVA